MRQKRLSKGADVSTRRIAQTLLYGLEFFSRANISSGDAGPSSPSCLAVPASLCLCLVLMSRGERRGIDSSSGSSPRVPKRFHVFMFASRLPLPLPNVFACSFMSSCVPCSLARGSDVEREIATTKSPTICREAAAAAAALGLPDHFQGERERTGTRSPPLTHSLSHPHSLLILV